MAADSSSRDQLHVPPTGSSQSDWTRKLFIAGGLIGLVAVFLPMASVSMEVPGFMHGEGTTMVVSDWRGTLSLIGYVAALVFAWLLYSPGRPPENRLTQAATGVGVALVLLGIWLLIDALQSRGAADWFGVASASASPGPGVFLNIVAAALVAIAAMAKGRKEGLF